MPSCDPDGWDFQMQLQSPEKRTSLQFTLYTTAYMQVLSRSSEKEEKKAV